MWKVVKYSKNRISKQSYLPQIQKFDKSFITKPKKKIEKLKKVLILMPHVADLLNLINFIYLSNILIPQIIQKEILQAGNFFCTNKAPELNQIPNKLIKVIITKRVNYLRRIFNDFLSLGYYSTNFKKSVIIILCKLEGNWDYTNPKNYHPISLLNI